MASAQASAFMPPQADAPGAALAALDTDLSVQGVHKRFDADKPILRGISFAVRRGESVALIGANGAGKSTLLRCCMRLLEPDQGRVQLLGQDVTHLCERPLRSLRARIGFVFQRHQLVPRLSALSNVIHGCLGRSGTPRYWLQSWAPRLVREEAMHCLERVGLTAIAGQRVDTLSGGQSQRVAIARALMQKPAFVMADEPVASLDPQAGEEVMELFVQLLRDEGVSLLYTSHHLEHAVRYSDRVIGLRQGQVEIDRPALYQDIHELRQIYA